VSLGFVKAKGFSLYLGLQDGRFESNLKAWFMFVLSSYERSSLEEFVGFSLELGFPRIYLVSLCFLFIVLLDLLMVYQLNA